MMEPSAIGQAWQKLNRGDAAAVATELADLSASAPEPAILLRGLAYFDAGDSAKAAADFEAVLARDPQNPVAASHLALAKFKTGDALGAANIFDAHPLFPQFGFLERFLHLFWPLRATTDIAAATYGEDKKPALSADFARFEAHADRVSKRQKKKLAKALMNECSKDFFNRHYVSARTLAQRALAVIPDGEDYIITNCAFAMLDGRTQDALELSEPLFQIVVGELTKDPSLSGNVPADVIMIRAAAMHALGKHEEALRLISTVAPMGPDDWGSHFFAAMAWHALGNRENARAAMQIALGPFFLDTWENHVQPFLLKTRSWLRTPEAAAFARDQYAPEST